MRNFDEILQELVNHPDFCMIVEMVDKDFIVDELFNTISDLDGYENKDEKIITALCEKWFYEHRLEMRNHFDRFFEKGEHYHYLSVDIESWLKKQEINS
jgi:hypothetical protein